MLKPKNYFIMTMKIGQGLISGREAGPDVVITACPKLAQGLGAYVRQFAESRSSRYRAIVQDIVPRQIRSWNCSLTKAMHHRFAIGDVEHISKITQVLSHSVCWVIFSSTPTLARVTNSDDPP